MKPHLFCALGEVETACGLHPLNGGDGGAAGAGPRGVPSRVWRLSPHLLGGDASAERVVDARPEPDVVRPFPPGTPKARRRERVAGGGPATPAVP